MKSKIPKEAFAYYVGLGEKRSYQATADHFGVSKCAVTKLAQREGWRFRLAAIESEARDRLDKKLADDIVEMRERHGKMLKVMSARVITALRDHPITDGMDAIRAADILMKNERAVAAEAVQRSESVVARVTREEIAQLVSVEPEEPGEPSQAGRKAKADDREDW